LRAIYGWYERNAELLTCVLRDAETHALTRAIAAERFGPSMTRHREVLGVKLGAKQRAMLELALSFYTWRTLVRENGLKPEGAVGAMIEAIDPAQDD
jgi:hypothetical protein